MANEFEDQYRLFLKKWGQESQERMAIEEMSELTKELCKKFRFYRNEMSDVSSEKLSKILNNIREEIADVLNMVEQLEICYGKDEIEKIRREKIKRTLKYISEEE